MDNPLSFEIKDDGRQINYKENGRVICIQTENDIFIHLNLASIRNWEPPYQYEYITRKDKQRILKNIQEKYSKDLFLRDRLVFDFKKGDSFKDIFFSFKIYSGISYSSVSSDEEHKYTYYEKIDNGIILCNIKQYNLFSDTDKRFFHELVLKDEKITEGLVVEKMQNNAIRETANYKISRLLKDYSKRRIAECKANPNQNPFNFGLYALNMILTEENREEIKQIVIEYKKISQEKGLNFNELLSQNIPINTLIKTI